MSQSDKDKSNQGSNWLHVFWERARCFHHFVVLNLCISMLDVLFVCSPSLNLIFPMMWGPESNWQEPGPNRRREVNGDLYYAGSGEWTWGKGTQEGARYLQGWPGTAENTGQPGPSPGGPQLCQGLQYNSSWLGDLGETEGVRKDKVCHVFHWFFPCRWCYLTLKESSVYPSSIL